VFERKMQERQEFLDHYFVFSDQTEYEPPKDYSRMNGALEDIRQSYMEVEEQRRLQELTRPREIKTHEPGHPLELPTSLGTSVATPLAPPVVSTPAQGAPAAPPPPPTLNVSPPVRNLEKIER
jgi:general secretion pathway protein D